MYLLYEGGRHAYEYLGATNKTTHIDTYTQAEGCDSGRQPLEVYKRYAYSEMERRDA